MKSLPALFFVALIGLVAPTQAQTPPSASFHGTPATKTHYYAAYELNTADTSRIQATLRNLQNALNDPRLKGKIDIELVVHGGGVAVYMKNSAYEKILADLQKQGVVLAMCENTMRGRKLSKDDLFPFVSYVPSGNGELVILGQQGWTLLHP